MTEDGRDACVGSTSLICSLVGLYIGNHYVDILVGVYVPVGDGYSAIAIYLRRTLYGLRAVGEEDEDPGTGIDSFFSQAFFGTPTQGCSNALPLCPRHRLRTL